VAMTLRRSSITSTSSCSSGVRMAPLAATLEGLPKAPCARRRSSFSLSSRGMHEIKGKGLMQLIDAIPEPLPASDCDSGGGEGGYVLDSAVPGALHLGHAGQGVGGTGGGSLLGGGGGCPPYERPLHPLGEEGARLGNQINDNEVEDVTTQGGGRSSNTSGRECESMSTQRMQEWMTRYIPMSICIIVHVCMHLYTYVHTEHCKHIRMYTQNTYACTHRTHTKRARERSGVHTPHTHSTHTHTHRSGHEITRWSHCFNS
jgi:hypothetical protein